MQTELADLNSFAEASPVEKKKVECFGDDECISTGVNSSLPLSALFLPTYSLTLFNRATKTLSMLCPPSTVCSHPRENVLFPQWINSLIILTLEVWARPTEKKWGDQKSCVVTHTTLSQNKWTQTIMVTQMLFWFLVNFVICQWLPCFVLNWWSIYALHYVYSSWLTSVQVYWHPFISSSCLLPIRPGLNNLNTYSYSVRLLWWYSVSWYVFRSFAA